METAFARNVVTEILCFDAVITYQLPITNHILSFLFITAFFSQASVQIELAPS
jgi:hypothetical protein